jgi:hypothetical protein
MNDLESRIRDELRGREGDAPAFDLSDAHRVAGRTRRRQILNVGGAGIGAIAVVVALTAGIGGLVRADRTPADQLPPATPTPRIEPSPGTTVSEQPAAEPFSPLEGEVTLYAAPPWDWSCCFGPWHLDLDRNVREQLYVVTDPRPVETSCRKGPAPADAQALARSILSDPDLEATGPVSARVGGVGALSMDVVAASAASVCDYWNAPLVVTSTGVEQSWASVALKSGRRMRLYLVDLPEGMSARILAIAIVAPEQSFEHVVEAAQPIVDSFTF